MSTKLSALTHSYETIRAKLVDNELSLHKRVSEHESFSRHVAELNLKLELKESEIQRLISDNTVSKEKITTRDSESNKVLLEKVKLEEKIRHLTEDKAAVNSTISRLEKVSQEYDDLKVKFREQIAEANHLKQELDTQISRNSKLRDLKKENQEERTKHAELHRLLQQAEDKIEKVSLEFLTLKSDHEKVQKEADTIRQKLEFVSDQKSQVERALSDRKKAEEELESELRDYQTSRGNHQRELDSLNSRVKNSKNENRNLLKDNDLVY